MRICLFFFFAKEDNYRHVMQTFLEHARERKRALDAEEANATRAIGIAWSCLDTADGGGGGGGREGGGD